MTFGRRLALFFLLIALVPTGALVGILLFVSEDSRPRQGGHTLVCPSLRP